MMTDSDLEFYQNAADRLVFCIAERAGVGSEDLLRSVQEEYLDTVDEIGTWAMEVWTVFEAESPEGQVYFAHLPGRLDSLIVRTVRDHSALLEGE